MRRGAAISELKATGETISSAIKAYIDRALADQARCQGIFDGITEEAIQRQSQPPGLFDGITEEAIKRQSQPLGLFDGIT